MCCSVSLASWRCGAGGGGWNPDRGLVARSWKSHSWRPEEDRSRDKESLSATSTSAHDSNVYWHRRGQWRCAAPACLPPRTLRAVNGVGVSPMTRAWCVGMGAELQTTAKRTPGSPGSRACGQHAGGIRPRWICRAVRPGQGGGRADSRIKLTGETGEASSSAGCECDPGYQSEPRRNGAWLQARIWPSNAPFSSLGASRAPSAPAPIVPGMKHGRSTWGSATRMARSRFATASVGSWELRICFCLSIIVGCEGVGQPAPVQRRGGEGGCCAAPFPWRDLCSQWYSGHKTAHTRHPGCMSGEASR